MSRAASAAKEAQYRRDAFYAIFRKRSARKRCVENDGRAIPECAKFQMRHRPYLTKEGGGE